MASRCVWTVAVVYVYRKEMDGIKVCVDSAAACVCVRACWILHLQLNNLHKGACCTIQSVYVDVCVRACW